MGLMKKSDPFVAEYRTYYFIVKGLPSTDQKHYFIIQMFLVSISVVTTC